MPIQELFRLLRNLIRLGTVAAIDHAQAQCRIQTGECLTDWLPWLTLAAGNTRTWQPPSLGEQVLLLCPNGELSAGIVLRGLYSDAYPAPSHQPDLALTVYPDGASFSYDPQQHQFNITLPSGGTVVCTAPGALTLQSPTLTLDAQHVSCTGDVTVQGHLSYAGGLSGQGGEGAQITGDIRASGEIQAGGISLAHHRHSGVAAGGNVSGGPL